MCAPFAIADTEPGSLAAAVPQKLGILLSQCQATAHTTLAPHAQLRQIAGSAVLVHPELAPSAVGVAAMGIEPPVDVADVPVRAGTDEPDRDHIVLLAVVVNEQSLRQRLEVNQATGTSAIRE